MTAQAQRVAVAAVVETAVAAVVTVVVAVAAVIAAGGVFKLILNAEFNEGSTSGAPEGTAFS
jgi:hypothetical protein